MKTNPINSVCGDAEHGAKRTAVGRLDVGVCGTASGKAGLSQGLQLVQVVSMGAG